MTHYVYIEDATTRSARFEEKYLGTDLKQAKKQADYFARHLTRTEMQKSDEIRLVACDIPENVDLDDLDGIFDDYVTEIIEDYKNNAANDGKLLLIDCKHWEEGSGYTYTETIENKNVNGDLTAIIEDAKDYCIEFLGSESAECKIMIYAFESDPLFDDAENITIFRVNMD